MLISHAIQAKSVNGHLIRNKYTSCSIYKPLNNVPWNIKYARANITWYGAVDSTYPIDLKW